MKISYAAADLKKGMTLGELETAINKAKAIAEINGTVIEGAKVTVLINFNAGIKQLNAEV